MAVPSKIYTLALGMQTVSLAEFRTGANGGLILARHEEAQLLPDPSADATRGGQLKIAVNELIERCKPGQVPVNYAISAQAVFTRFVKLPSVGEEKIDQIVTFEAQQNVPFPINEVVWDYQLVGDTADGQMEVVLVAIKSDLLNELSEAVEEAGLQSTVVDVGPMALYNAFRYNYSNVREPVLLIDVGARTTSVIFIEPGRIFSRSIPIGGSTITQAIAKEFKEPMMAAEERKKRDAFVSLGGSYAEPDNEEVARVSKMVRNTMTRLHAEISRSISFYRAQQQGSAPVRAYLSGGSASMPYTREFFAEKLKIPVEYFNALRNVTVTPPMKAEVASRRAHLLGELVGLALRSTSACPMELNLRPPAVTQAQEMKRRQPFLVLAAVCLLLTLAAWGLFYGQAEKVQAEVLEGIKPQVSQLRGFENRFKAVRREIADEQATAAPYIEALIERDYWVEVISELNARLPAKGIWITVMEPGFFSDGGSSDKSVTFASIAPGEKAPNEAPPKPVRTGPPGPGRNAPTDRGAGLRVTGLYLDNPNVVDEFLQSLAESPYFDIDLARREFVNPVRQTPTATEWAFPFELRLKLKDAPFAS